MRPVALFLAALATIPAAALAQDGNSALRKSDLVRFLTGTTYSKSEIAGIVRRSCLAFVPTTRDRQDLSELGATERIFREIDDCVKHGNRPVATRTPPPPPKPLAITPVKASVSAMAGTVATFTVQLRRGRTPEPGVRLVLRGTDAIPGGAGEEIGAVTDSRGRATFTVPTGTRAGAYPLTIAAPEGTTLTGSADLTLVTTPATARSVTLDPEILAVSPTEHDAPTVKVTVADAYGNAIAGREVEFRPPQRAGFVPETKETDAQGEATFSLPARLLRDRDTIGVYVAGKQLATVHVTTSASAVAANVAAGRTAGLMLEAARLAATGNHAKAEAVYDSVLAVDPNILAARLGRAYVRSWQREDTLARQDFQGVLRVDTANVSALTGLGYNYAWAGDWDDAEARFQQALHYAPENIDADKGLAYVSLWRGDSTEAVRRFQDVVERHPHDAEALVGLGQASLKAGNTSRARDAFRRALALDPTRADARQGLAATRVVTRPRVELSLWGGYTAFSGVNDTPLARGNGDTGQFGVRFAEAAYWLRPNVRLWAQYENGLTLDNIAFVRAGETAPAYYLGGFVNYGAGRYTSRLEGGFRDLPGGVRQTLVRGEQVFDVTPSTVVKAGGWLGPRNDHRTEWLGYGAVGFQVAPRLRVEPTFFYSRSGFPGESQRRVLLYGEYAFRNGWKVGTGIAGGVSDLRTTPSILPGDPLLPDGTDREKLWDAYVITEAPFGAHRAHMLLRHQQILHGTGLTVVALGVTLGF
ncbi:MAG TPA: tetratricopeptide repeat protein [Gemmatimonadaceae bacterium]